MGKNFLFCAIFNYLLYCTREIPKSQNGLQSVSRCNKILPMAEIKSSIELAMERTRDLHLTSEEKGKLGEEAIKNKAQGIVARYRDEVLSLDDLEEELKKHPEESRDFLNRHIVRELIQTVSVTTDNQRILVAITYLKKEKVDPGVLKKINDLIKEAQAALAEDFSTVESHLRKGFSAIEIGGNAVVPNTKESPEWLELRQETVAKFEQDLRLLKEKI